VPPSSAQRLPTPLKLLVLPMLPRAVMRMVVVVPMVVMVAMTVVVLLLMLLLVLPLESSLAPL